MIAGGDSVYTVPGSTALTALTSAELYDPVANAWSPAGNMTTGRELHTATLLPNGKVLVAGGVESNGGPTATAELYDPIANFWPPTAGLSTALCAQSATRLPSGGVLMVGGSSGTYIVGFSSVEVYW